MSKTNKNKTNKNKTKEWIVLSNGSEIIITDAKRGDECMRQFFTEGGRVWEDYYEDYIDDCAVRITPGLLIG